jgi:hypothetical protein
MNRAIFGVLAAFLTASCAVVPDGVANNSPAPVPSHTLNVSQPAHGYFVSVAWPSGGWIYAGYLAHPEVYPHAFELWRMREDGSNFQKVALPDDPACERTSYGGVSVLHDGRLAVNKLCDKPLGTSPTATYGVVAYDPLTGKTETLVPLQSEVNPGATSWNPTIDRAIASESSGICGSIAWLTRTGPEYIRIKLGEGTRQWALDAYFRAPASQDCTNQGRAVGGAWSPDGRQVAFLASPQSIGLSGQARLDAPWNIYLMDPTTLQPRPVLRDIKYAAGVSWSPDGQWLAFSGQPSGKSMGSWLFAPGSGALLQVSNTAMQAMTWAPDGQRLLGMWSPSTPAYPPDTRLVVLDVQALIAP